MKTHLLSMFCLKVEKWITSFREILSFLEPHIVLFIENSFEKYSELTWKLLLWSGIKSEFFNNEN
jgi:hypothetical protein